MTIDNLIVMLNNRLQFLQSQRPVFVLVGDVSRVIDLDGEITQTQLTLGQLHQISI